MNRHCNAVATRATGDAAPSPQVAATAKHTLAVLSLTSRSLYGLLLPIRTYCGSLVYSPMKASSASSGTPVDRASSSVPLWLFALRLVLVIAEQRDDRYPNQRILEGGWLPRRCD